jgi:dTDP-4-amino-4,6-dideoxygalactose transaminase
MLGYGRQSIDPSDIAAVTAVLRGEALTCGPAVEAFEAAIREHSGAAHAVAVSNGTSALRLLYQAVGIGPGMRVGVPAITFVATASQALLLGAEVVLLDVDPATQLLTPQILADCRERLDWVVPVHLAGRLCDLEGIAAVAAQRGIAVLEDAAHAFGSRWSDGRRCGDGAWSRGAIFSFHPVKNVTTGEGGAVVCNDAGVAARLRQLRHHGIVREGFRGDLAAAEAGQPWYHEFHQPATNERLSDLHAALGASQCRRLDAFRAARATVHRRYREALADLPWLTLPPPAPGQDPCWHLCAARFDWARLGLDRAACFASARAAGIALQVHYIPLHHQPALAGVARASDLAGADRAYAGLVSLPCHAGLSEGDLDTVIAWVRSLKP